MSHMQGIMNTQLFQTAIDTPSRTAAPAGPLSSVEAAGGAVSLSSAAATAGSASLSGAGTVLASADTDDVRSAKVAQLKSAIDSGTYNVPAGDVADKLISHLLG